MTDEFERRLQASFQRAALPAAPDRLRDFLGRVPAMEPRQTPAPRYAFVLQAAAAVAVVAVSVGILVFAMSLQGLPAADPSPSPTPSAPAATSSPAPTEAAPPTEAVSPTASPPASDGPLPERPAELLADRADASVRFEHSFGPADRPVSDDATLERIDLGREELSGSVVLSAACLGPGELELEIRLPAIPGSAGTFVGLVAPCDGDSVTIDYPATAGQPEPQLQLVSVSAARGASWRLVAAEVPSQASQPPDFAPIEGTPGWWVLWDTDFPDQATPAQGSGVEMKVPQPVTELGVTVQCADAASMTVVLSHPSDPTADAVEETMTCPTDDAGVRFTFPVAGGDHVKLMATPDAPAWVRLFVEGDEQPVATYPDAPRLPDGIADMPYAIGNSQYFAVSTFGSNRQQLIFAPGAYPWPIAGGDFVALGENGPESTVLYLVSISEGKVLRPIAELPADRYIGATWVDPEHGQVFFLVGGRREPGFEIRRVGLDGSGEQVVITVPPDSPLAAFDLALDYSVFVLDACPGGECSRFIVDAETLESRTVPIDVDGEICDVLGVADDVVVIQASSSCQNVGPDRTMATSLDGTEARVLEGVTTGAVIRTADGPHIAHMPGMSGPVEVVHLVTGDSRTLVVEADGLRLEPHLRLPADWLLLTPWHGVGDFPADQLGKAGRPGVLVNVLSGETIDMVNLPH